MFYFFLYLTMVYKTDELEMVNSQKYMIKFVKKMLTFIDKDLFAQLLLYYSNCNIHQTHSVFNRS